MDTEEKAIIAQYRAQLDAEIKRRRFFTPPAKKDTGPLAREAEQWVSRFIEQLGYRAAPTVANAPFDLWAWDDNGGAARIEVKISLYHPYQNYGRYQAAIRNHEHDVVVFIARNGRDWPFVIPAPLVPAKSLTIWSKCPADSKPYRPYLAAWDVLHHAIAISRPIGWQLPLL